MKNCRKVSSPLDSPYDPDARSDYDVRFIYCHPRDWYLSVYERSDVIERPIDAGIDLSGWDIRKALRLFRKSNPPLLEWLNSPIVYAVRGSFAGKLKELLPRYYSPRACLHHYWHMAQGNFDKYLCAETVSLKRYFYVLRPVLACCWIERKTEAVPMEFAKLLEAIVPVSPLKSAIGELLENKQRGVELGEGPRIPVIHVFLELELKRISEVHGVCKAATTAPDQLDALFRATLEEVWQ